MKLLLNTQQPPWLMLSTNTGAVVKEDSTHIWIEMPTVVTTLDGAIASKDTALSFDEQAKLKTKQTTTIYKRERGVYDTINKDV